MSITAFIVGVVRENRDGTDRQGLIARLQNDEEVYLYDAGTDRNPDRIAVRNYDSHICGFLDSDLAYAIRQYTRNVGRIQAYVSRVVRERDGAYQCEIELDIPGDSAIASMYYGLLDDHEGERQAPGRPERRSIPTENRTPSRARTNETRLSCPKCGSTNTNVQMVSETDLKIKRRGCFWWLLVGWWWVPFKWLFLTVPALIVKIFSPTKYKTRTRHTSMVVCQNCGNHWRA